MTYFNPKSIQGFNNAATGKFLKKLNATDIGFSDISCNRKFVEFNGVSWNLNDSDNIETFTYGEMSSDIMPITVIGPASDDSCRIVHTLRLCNTDSETHTVSFVVNNGSLYEFDSSQNYTIYGNSVIEFSAIGFKKTALATKTTISISAVFGYTSYSVTNPEGYITQNDVLQSNWNETDPLSPQFILNKPDLIEGITFNGSPAVITDGIAAITASIPAAQIQSDWNQTDNAALDFIKNKPVNLSQFNNDLTPTTMDVVVNSDQTNVTITVHNSNGTTSQYNIPLSSGSGSLSQLPANWTETNTTSVQYILNKPTLATVATTGSYTDLTNTPSIPSAQVNSDWNAVSGIAQILNKPALAAVATTGSYSDLTGTPSIPVIGSLNTDNGISLTVSSSESFGGVINLHRIAKTGNYNDLLNKPTIPAAQVQANWNETNTSSKAYIQNKPTIPAAQVNADWEAVSGAAQILNKPVLFSGDYNDLTNKPSIPSAQVNSDWNAVSGVSQILNKPSIPENMSDLNNDEGYITNDDISDIITDTTDYLRFEFRNGSTGLLLLKAEGTPSTLSLEYKTVSLTTGSVIEDWTEWDVLQNTNDRTLQVNGYTVVYLRGDNYTASTFNTSNYYHFVINSDNCYCGGNLLTIYKKDGNVTSVNQDYRFYRLFAKFGAYLCKIQSAPYVRLNSASSNCFNNMFEGNAGTIAIRKLGSDVIIGSDDYNNSVLATHTLGTSIDQKTGRIYVEKPAVSSYITTLVYGDTYITWSSLMSDYNAGKHIRCKETVNGETLYADLYSYEVVGTQQGDMPTFTFKYVESETERNCTVYKCQYLQGTVGWLKTTESLDEIPLPSTYGQFLTYDDTNGLTWDDVLPDQTGQSGKYLSTDGTSLSWQPASGGGVAQVQADWTETNASVVSYIKHKPDLATVATSGSYNDLTNKPTIPAAQTNSDWNSTGGVTQILNKPSLAVVATSGSYTDLLNKPTIPTTTGQLVNNSGFITEETQSDWNESDTSSAAYIKNKPVIPAAQVNSDWNASSGIARILNKPTLATVATSGSYNDLTNRPTIPAAQVNSDWNASTGVARILNKPTLATVATSGSYNDLTDKPTIPAAQVQSNWTETNTSSKAYIQNKPSLATVATSGNYTDLTNTPSLATVATSGSYNDLTNRPTIPAAQIQSNWEQANEYAVDYIKNKPNLQNFAYNALVFAAKTSTMVNSAVTLNIIRHSSFVLWYTIDTTNSDRNYSINVNYSSDVDNLGCFDNTIIIYDARGAAATNTIQTQIQIFDNNAPVSISTWLSTNTLPDYHKSYVAHFRYFDAGPGYSKAILTRDQDVL